MTIPGHCFPKLCSFFIFILSFYFSPKHLEDKLRISSLVFTVYLWLPKLGEAVSLTCLWESELHMDPSWHKALRTCLTSHVTSMWPRLFPPLHPLLRRLNLYQASVSAVLLLCGLELTHGWPFGNPHFWGGVSIGDETQNRSGEMDGLLNGRCFLSLWV